jgi:hypothetical protein
MQNVLLFSENKVWVQQSSEYLHDNLPYAFTGVKESDEIYDVLSRVKVDLIVYRDLDGVHFALDLIKSLRINGYRNSILFVTSKIKDKNFFKMAEDLKIYVLQSPYEEKNLEGLIKKLMYSRSVPQQYHQRYETIQNAELEYIYTGENMNSTIRNLSVGGAYIEVGADRVLNIGDQVKIKIDLKDVNKEHNLSAKVVWMKRTGATDGRYGVGLKFESIERPKATI